MAARTHSWLHEVQDVFAGVRWCVEGHAGRREHTLEQFVLAAPPFFFYRRRRKRQTKRSLPPGLKTSAGDHHSAG